MAIWQTVCWCQNLERGNRRKQLNCSKGGFCSHTGTACRGLVGAAILFHQMALPQRNRPLLSPGTFYRVMQSNLLSHMCG